MNDLFIAHIGHTTKSDEHITWWKPDSRGYTFCIKKAGRYSLKQAESICQYGSCIAVHEEDLQELAKGTPYYRRSDGELSKLYDGGDLVVIPNNKQAWTHLLSARVSKISLTDKPTPIGAKARAIYLPALRIDV